MDSFTMGAMIVAIMAIVIGGGILGYAGLILARKLRRKDWSITAGEIIASEINTFDTGEGINYFPAIRYRYRVNSVDYESDVITTSAPPSIGMQGYAKAMVKKYQLQSKVDVYYNPDSPEDAVLDKKVSLSGIFLLFILGIPVLLCGFFFLFLFLIRADILKGIEL